MKGTITQITDLTSDIKSFHINIPDKPSYKPGQFLMVSVEIDGKVYKRPYSLVSAPHWENIEIMVKRHKDGFVSKKMHQLQVGDSLEFAMPYGHFTLPPLVPEKLVFIAHNVGLSAVLGILRDLEWHKDPSEKMLIYVNPTVADIAYKDELMRLAAEGLKIIYVITHDEDWKGQAGIDKSFIESHCDKDSYFLVHAHPQAAALIQQDLEHLGVDKNSICLDRW